MIYLIDVNNIRRYFYPEHIIGLVDHPDFTIVQLLHDRIIHVNLTVEATLEVISSRISGIT